jgi:hypothetical protein
VFSALSSSDENLHPNLVGARSRTKSHAGGIEVDDDDDDDDVVSVKKTVGQSKLEQPQQTLDQIAAARAAGKLDAMLTSVWKRLVRYGETCVSCAITLCGHRFIACTVSCLQNVLTADNNVMSHTIDKMGIRLVDAENQLKQAASAERMQTLGVVLEEQRMRVDSILLGEWLNVSCVLC